jgi:hypothetical protein
VTDLSSTSVDCLIRKCHWVRRLGVVSIASWDFRKVNVEKIDAYSIETSSGEVKLTRYGLQRNSC